MQPAGYSPYRQQRPTRKGWPQLKLPQGLGKAKKWIFIALLGLFGLFVLFYIALGPLRFFANHALALGFFPKDYLILLQNDEELRPGGGFITAYGELRVTLGIPSLKKVANSYEIDTENYVTPPFPHEKLLKNEWYSGYTFRDANWNPDFPQAADDLIDFYKAKFPEKEVDGVVVLNFSVIEKMLEAFGPVEVAGKTLSAETLFGELSQEVNNVDRHNVEELKARKGILGELSQALMAKAKRHPFKTKRVVTQALEEKEMYFWFAKNRLQKRLEAKDWANHLSLTEGSDFLALNFANLGSKKADRYVEKEAHWHADLSGSVPQMRLEVTLRHPGKTSAYADDYKGYLRIYLPGGASVGDLPEGALKSDEGDFAVIGQELAVKAGDSETWSYSYTLPRSLLDEKGYHLKLAKQSGEALWLDASVEAAEGLLLSSPQWVTREHMAFFRGILEKDSEVELVFGPDRLAPYPVVQQFENLKEMTVTWNEPMDEESMKDALNYSLSDLNETDEKTTDEVKVVYAEALNPKVVRLELEGATKQDLERYGLTMKGLRDQHGNATDPTPLVVTVVQRIKEKTK